jgi:hypothetical protein
MRRVFFVLIWQGGQHAQYFFICTMIFQHDLYNIQASSHVSISASFVTLSTTTTIIPLAFDLYSPMFHLRKNNR